MDAQNAGGVRGTVIKVPDASPGILFVNGQQQYFTLERVWKSPVAPTPNMAVNVEFDGSGAITAVSVVDQQQLNKERMSQLGGAAQQKGKEAAKLAQQGVGVLAGKMGAIPLGAAVFVVIAFFFFPALAITFFGQSQTFTFWDFAGMDPSGRGFDPTGVSHGFFALIGLAALAAPFAAPFLKQLPWARWLNVAPLAYVLLTVAKFHWEMPSAAKQMGMADLFSYTWGFYLLVIGALVLAAFALKKPSA